MADAGKVAFCFPGQGSQEPGMGRAMAEAVPEARAVYERASHALGFDLAAACFDGTMERLSETEVTQPAIIAMHHPPVTPYPFMDKLKFDGRDSARLENLLAQFPNVQTMFAGHFHFGGRNTFANAELILGPSLVEHPHPYRIVEAHEVAKGHGAISYEWKSLELHGEEDLACEFGTAGVRSLGLMGLFYNRNGFMPLALPT